MRRRRHGRSGKILLGSPAGRRWHPPRIGQMIRRHPAMWPFIGAISLAYRIIVLSAYHDWNDVMLFLRSYILTGIRQER